MKGTLVTGVRRVRTAAAVGQVGAVGPLHAEGRLDGWWGTLRRLRAGRLWAAADVEAIRTYWGEGVAFYFAWQTYYLQALLAPAVAGVALWWRRPAGVSVDDDPWVPLFSVGAVLWGVAFVHGWRRRQSHLAFKWGTDDIAAADGEEPTATAEPLRADFEGEEVVSAVTGGAELVFRHRGRRYALSLLVSGACLLPPVVVMFLSLNLQGYIDADHPGVWGVRVHVPALAAYAAPGAPLDPAGALSLLPVVLHGVVIALLNGAYKAVAHRLTEQENHRTQRAHDNSLILKRFVFEAFDCYVALFYIAFGLADVNRLRVELVSLFSSDTARRVTTESVLPLLVQQLGKWRARKGGGGTAAAPASSSTAAAAARLDMALEPHDDFDDYLEMVIQFGYVTLFASAFPLAAALSLGSNCVELLSDLFKLAFLCRRPPAVRAANIGMWERLLYALVLLSVFTNLWCFAFGSDQMALLFPRLFRPDPINQLLHGGEHEYGVKKGMGRFVVLLLGAVEHALLLLLLGLELLLPNKPSWVRLTLARREHEARTLLREVKKER